jgi:hypothetical protein
MGAWGPAIFSDDTASDIREEYREAIAKGASAEAAREKIIAAYTPHAEDPDYAAVVWLALALTQWSLGRLEDRIRDEAVKAIDSGAAIEGWLGTASEKPRRAALAKARETLLSPPPPPKTPKRETESVVDWEAGELVAYRLKSGDNIVLHAHELCRDKGGPYTLFECLDWRGSELPTDAMLQSLPYARPTPSYVSSLHPNFLKALDDHLSNISRVYLVGLKPRALKTRFHPLRRLRPPFVNRYNNVWPAAHFDDYLEKVFGWK